MTQPVAIGSVVEQGRTADPWTRARFTLLLVVVGIVAGALLLGTSASTLDDLKAGIAAGQVDEVRVSGALPPQGSGYASVTLRWRDGARDRFTEVTQLSDGSVATDPNLQGSPSVVGSLDDALHAVDASVSVVHDGGGVPGSEVAGIRVPGWLLVAALVAWLATLALVVNGAEPWWATRWAWFWLVFSPASIVAAPLFLVASGPAPGIPYASPRGRRLTGGWAFLLVLVLGPLFAART